jgi:trimethylamine--corrinoid protein Co-methyltransferase
MTFLRDEYFQGNGVSVQKSRIDWEEEGARDARSRAHTMVENILAQDEKSYIPKQIEREVREKYTILL